MRKTRGRHRVTTITTVTEVRGTHTREASVQMVVVVRTFLPPHRRFPAPKHAISGLSLDREDGVIKQTNDRTPFFFTLHFVRSDHSWFIQKGSKDVAGAKRGEARHMQKFHRSVLWLPSTSVDAAE